MPIGFILCNSIVSLSNTCCAITPRTNLMSAVSNQREGTLGSQPNLICQICHSLGHATNSCPIHYQPHQPPVRTSCLCYLQYR